MKKRITYKPVCRVCGNEKNLVTVKRAEGDYHLCPKHAPKWMTKKRGGNARH